LKIVRAALAGAAHGRPIGRATRIVTFGWVVVERRRRFRRDIARSRRIGGIAAAAIHGDLV